MLSSVLLFLNIGSGEMILIVFAALMLFGGNKLPEIARGLGKGIRDFKDASEDVKREINNQINNYDDKKAEKAEALAVAEPVKEEEPEQNTAYTYEPVAGTVPAYTGYTSGSDAIEEPEAEKVEIAAEDATYEHEAVNATEHKTIDLTKKEDEQVKKPIEEV